MSWRALAALTSAVSDGESIHPAALAWRPACWRRTRRGLSSAPFAWGRLLPALFASARAWVHWALNRPQNCSGTPGGQKSSRRPLGRWRLPRAHFKNHFENRPLPFANAQTAKHPRGPNFHKRSRGTPPERRPISKTKSELPIFRSSPAARYPLAFSLSLFHFSAKNWNFFHSPLFQAPNHSRYFW